jgi:hypothetical protein
MTRWKRFGISIASLAIAELIFSLIFAIQASPQKHWWTGAVAGLAAISIFAIPGWILTLPIILSVQKITGRHLWVLGVIGTLIGPFVIGAIDLISWKLDRSAGTDFEWGVIGIATAISFLTTALYLASLKHFSHPTPTLSS